MANSIIKIIGNSLNAISYISPKYASDKALDLFATPRKGRVLENQKAFLDSAKTHQLKYEDFNILTYNWKSTGKTILLAHGWESNTHRWEVLINQLRALDYNVIALDAPAHGASSGKQFNAVIYSECIHLTVEHYKPDIIIGHSVGGMASGFYQNKYQNKNLEKLILLGAPSEFTGVFKRYVDMMGYNKRIENGLNNLVLERFNNLPSYFSLANFAKNIETETLIIHDVEDKIIPYNDAKLIVENHKKATFISTTGYGHGLRNDVVNNHILEYIAS
ncbi:alpha/beta hydrolase [Lacinutrix sp. Bg11-31]|uniref:alpha/beta hydrolase n=1 Tax=Lacinutrix sp. Bg11-31 TaxID=2057808 RepID=UPI000C311E30|nr:alpha/beta hydrolase [Lacinutrix sp. Bg11-31]AUC82290.1 alpha/beta hydrolase [Lacinutrix sp. Bg11-31]